MMVVGKSGNRTYYKNILGYRGSMTELKNGNVRLIICSPKGEIILNKKYKNRMNALKAWNQCEVIKQD